MVPIVDFIQSGLTAIGYFASDQPGPGFHLVRHLRSFFRPERILFLMKSPESERASECYTLPSQLRARALF